MGLVSQGRVEAIFISAQRGDLPHPVESVTAVAGKGLDGNRYFDTGRPEQELTLIESEQLTDGPVGIGTKVREVRQFLGVRVEMAWEVTEYEPTSKSSIKGISGPVPLSGSYLLEPADGGTRFIVVGELDAHGFFKLAEPVFARMTGRELEANLGHLKDLLEAAKESS